MGMANLQRMAMQMQQDMARAQAELEKLVTEGSAGGGVVKATVGIVSGKQVLTSLTIDKSAVDPDDVEMLQDLVLAAVSEALKASQDAADQKMGSITSGLKVPGMF
jgi:nucleoid-associated protein EbfC